MKKLRIKKILALSLWALISFAINTQFDPTTVIGSAPDMFIVKPALGEY
jgi:hypothetical protein